MTKKQQSYQFKLLVLAVVFSAAAVILMDYYSNGGMVAGLATGF